MRPIDADALQQVFNEVSTSLMRKPALTKDIEHMVRAFLMTTEMIKDAPTIEVEPVRHERWIPTEYDSYADGAPVWDKWECSECGYEHSGDEDTLTSFCPNCGAIMDGGAD